MRLKKYHCKIITCRFVTESNNFRTNKFFKDPRLVAFLDQWAGGDTLGHVYETKNRRIADYHAHSDLELVRKKKVRLKIEWVQGIMNPKKDSDPPFAEDVAKWFSRFFAPEVYSLRVSSIYEFPLNKYASSLGLPFPLWSQKGEKRKSVIQGFRVSTTKKGVTGVSVVSDISEKEKRLSVFVAATYRARLNKMGPENILKNFDSIVQDFVEKR